MLREVVKNNPVLDLVILSGRDRFTLQQWFQGIDLGLIAENGAWIKFRSSWQAVVELSMDWKKQVRQVMGKYHVKVPGSFLEEKESSFVWHYRNGEIALSNARTKDLVNEMIFILDAYDLEISLEIKSVEIRKKGVSKEHAIRKLLDACTFDFIACFGDDPVGVPGCGQQPGTIRVSSLLPMKA